MGMSTKVFEVQYDGWMLQKVDLDLQIARREAVTLGVSVAHVQKSSISFELEHSTPCLVINGTRNFAEILVGSRSSVLIADSVQDAVHAARVFIGDSYILMTSGAKHLFVVEGLLQRLLQVHLQHGGLRVQALESC